MPLRYMPPYPRLGNDRKLCAKLSFPSKIIDKKGHYPKDNLVTVNCEMVDIIVIEVKAVYIDLELAGDSLTTRSHTLVCLAMSHGKPSRERCRFYTCSQSVYKKRLW